MITLNKINHIDFDEVYLYLHSDGKTFRVPLEKTSKKLQDASAFQRDFFKISPSGYGIHWPLIDEDLAIEALLRHAL
jgi:hypothetical protein